MGKFKPLIGLFVYIVVFTWVSGALMFRFGPFDGLRRMAAQSALYSMRHKWMARFFLSRNELIHLINEDRRDEGPWNNSNPFWFAERHDRRIEHYIVRANRFIGHVLLVHDPLSVSVGLSSRMPYSGETTSNIAKHLGAIAAINAGGFGDRGYFTSTGGVPDNFVVHNGRFVFSSSRLDRGERVGTIGFTRRGVLIVGRLTKREILSLGIREAVSFGPPIIVNGKPQINQKNNNEGIAPRTAIGQRRDGAVIMLVVDGRQVDSIGASMRDIQNIMLSYGAYVAANLDGGSSTTMYYRGKIINHPSDPLGERMVATAFVVK